MADMQKLRKRRAMVKAKLTRLRTRVEQVQDDQANQEEIETYLSRLKEIQNEFESVQYEIGASSEGATTADATEDEEFEERHLELSVKLKQRLNKLSTPRGDSRPSTSDEMLSRVLLQQGELIQRISMCGDVAPASNNNDAITKLFEQQTQLLRSIADSSNVLNSQESRVKLPVVKLPAFDGRTEEWKRFSETFQSLIHSNENIANIQKFQYLVTSLSGTAAKVIESIELTSDNYVVAWELLKRRFDDPRAIKKKHIQCLFSMPKVDRESATAIRGLLDYTLKHLRVLKSLSLPTDSWSELIIHMIEAKLDTVTLRAWEQSPSAPDATLADFIEFLERKCQTLERLEARTKEKDVVRKAESDKPRAKVQNREKTAALTNATGSGRCYLCDGNHALYRCEKFLVLQVDDRIKEVKRLRLCMNCLRKDHFAKTCKMGSCRECPEKHNTLCHRPTSNANVSEETNKPEQNDKANKGVTTHHVARDSSKKRVITLSTAVVGVRHPNGSIVPLRVLLDSASEAHFITYAACSRIGVKRDRASETITGINGIENAVNQCCDVVIRARHSNASSVIRSFVVSRITKRLPAFELDRNAIPIPSNIVLADPEFYKQGSTDMLIGAEFFFDWLESGKIELGNNLPIIQNTKLGWIVAGSFTDSSVASSACENDPITTLVCLSEHRETLDQSLRRFWELENHGSDVIQNRSSETCESDEFFEKTTTRTNDGRFIVRIPFLENPKMLGESRETAYKRLMQLERRFRRDETLSLEYSNFMRDYLDTGHMSLIADTEAELENRANYLPHHGVFKKTSSSTRLRVVFDASSRTSSGKSLNDLLRVGPTIQSNLFDIVIRFRFYNVALTSDIRKMYRQVLVHPDDRDYQRVLWRFVPEEPVQAYRLNTVTYGQACSSYLATKCVNKLAVEAGDKFLKASQALIEQTYVDDILTGADNVEDAILLQEQITEVLRSGGFETHKWCSSHSEVLQQIPTHLVEDTSHLNIGDGNVVKTLGNKWNPQDDQFQFTVHGMQAVKTKRGILSEISKLFDPLGLIGPVITAAKLIMQETWLLESQWDEPLSDSFVEKWDKLRREMHEANHLYVPRRVIPSATPTRVCLQGFCDASERAYGACLYVQSINEHGEITSRLLCSKSRVAPIKTTTVPRLEFCGAVLLAHLIANVLRILNIHVDEVKAWSDSQVVLWWIRGDPTRWKPFVANRVREIVELLPANHWHHVKGVENPADLISRGATLSHLRNSKLWWFEPRWLQEPEPSDVEEPQEYEPSIEVYDEIRTEERRGLLVCTLLGEENSTLQEMIDNCSSLTRIERVLAYCLRYISNLQKRPGERILSNLSVIELQEAHNLLIRHAQGSAFSSEIADLRKGRAMPLTNKIFQLHPFWMIKTFSGWAADSSIHPGHTAENIPLFYLRDIVYRN